MVGAINFEERGTLAGWSEEQCPCQLWAHLSTSDLPKRKSYIAAVGALKKCFRLINIEKLRGIEFCHARDTKHWHNIATWYRLAEAGTENLSRAVQRKRIWPPAERMLQSSTSTKVAKETRSSKATDETFCWILWPSMYAGKAWAAVYSLGRKRHGRSLFAIKKYTARERTYLICY